MTFLYFDIETLGLNPYYPDSKVIVITYRLNNEPIQILKEWESDENTILTEFYSLIRELINKGTLQYVGFNILHFDIPFLLTRMILNNIAKPIEIYETFFRTPYKLDIRAMLLPDFNFRFSGLKWDAVLDLFGFPQKFGSNIQIKEWYEKKQYQKIVNYCKSEFLISEVFKKIKKFWQKHRKKLNHLANKRTP